MEPIHRLNSDSMFADSYHEKEDVIKNLFHTVLTGSVKEIDEKNYHLIETSMKHENEINRCIDMSNYYINEAFSSILKTEEVRRKLRVHIYTVFNDGDKEINYPADIKVEDSSNVYKYVTPSSFTFNIHGYILNTDENDYDSCESERLPSKTVNEEEDFCNNSEGAHLEGINIKGDHLKGKSGLRVKEEESKYSGTEIDDISESNEQIDYCNTSVMKFTSFFSTIMVMRDKETIIYDKKNKNYYDCDKLTFTRIVNERKKETIKVFLFLDQKIPFFELSPELNNFMQSPEETMPEIIKRIYEYSLEKDLIDFTSKMKTDEVLKTILEVEEYEFSDLPNLLQKHISIQKPIVLEHVLDLENEDESESIYDIVIDMFEPFMTLEDGKYRKFVLDSHHLSNLLEFLKMNEVKDISKKHSSEDSIAIASTNEFANFPNGMSDRCDNGSEEKCKAEEEEELDGNDYAVNNNTRDDAVNYGNNQCVHAKKNTQQGDEEILGELHDKSRDKDKKYKDRDSCAAISIFEKMNGLQNEIEDIDDSIIDILCKIKQKNSLRLRYTNFYENPCGFIDHVMNSKIPVNLEDMNDTNFIYDQAANINDDNYYKLPWVHRGISKYFLIKNKNLDDVLKSVLNSMNLDCKRKTNDMNPHEIKKQKIARRSENSDNHFKEPINNTYKNEQELNNNAYYYFPNKNMNYSTPEPFNNSVPNYANNLNYEDNNAQNASGLDINGNTQNNKLTAHINSENSYMQNNEQANFNMYNSQHVGPYPQYMNFSFNEMNPHMNPQMHSQMNRQIIPQMHSQINPQMHAQMNPQMHAQIIPQMNPQMNAHMNPQMNAQNNFNSIYNGTLPMEMYPNENFYSSNNFVP
ncbi:SWIB/MDM2 domain-containing protein, putative [Plasmodium ovale]|uniref:SWIB/MDM2 domain-containing protein, putative n=1 Tax=Plasmodium ovale TaxID=36330 RepID=A0A1D3TJP9_PLAOA|nr:SWIB/MDM2 domain-containing protein, putative [Plasmodium ovale]